MSTDFSCEARVVHAGTHRAEAQPATSPLIPANIYVSWGEPVPGRGYGRDRNPGWEALEEAIGGIEDAEAVVFASGQESTWERRSGWSAETAPDSLIRLSVGVDPAADLITDIDAALEVLSCASP